MQGSVNYITLIMICRHKNFLTVAQKLEKFGFDFYCVHKMTLEYATIHPRKNNIIQMPIDGYECRGTLNSNRFDDKLIAFIKQNHQSNGGCIAHYTISE